MWRRIAAGVGATLVCALVFFGIYQNLAPFGPGITGVAEDGSQGGPNTGLSQDGSGSEDKKPGLEEEQEPGGSPKRQSPEAGVGPDPFEEVDFPLRAKSGILMVVETGQVLASKNPDLKNAPASLVKIMTMKVALEAVKQGVVQLDTRVRVSRQAWEVGQGTSTMFLNIDERVTLEDLLFGVGVVSGNDASVAVAELLAGAEELFVQRMNRRAGELGLENTRFVNAHGLDAEGQYTTARDMALLARAFFRDHPKDLERFAGLKKFTFNGITQYNRNGLLGRYEGVNGLKTGFTESAGYNIAVTARRGEMGLVAVVMGAQPEMDDTGKVVKSGERVREEEAAKLLNFGFMNFTNVRIAQEGEKLGTRRVWKGKTNQVELVIPEEVVVTLPKTKIRAVEQRLEITDPIFAPLKKGEKIGVVKIRVQGQEVTAADVVAGNRVEAGSLVKRFLDTLRIFLLRLVGQL